MANTNTNNFFTILELWATIRDQIPTKASIKQVIHETIVHVLDRSILTSIGIGQGLEQHTLILHILCKYVYPKNN